MNDNNGNNPKMKEQFKLLREKNLELTKIKLKESVKEDTLISHAMNAIIDINKIINMIAKDLREWYELHNPEFSRETPEHEIFADMILKFDKKELLKKISVKEEDSIGAELKEKDLQQILGLARHLKALYELKAKKEEYLEEMVKEYCPNIYTIAGTELSAKLIHHVGSLKRLAEMPSSKIQILGAEKALFRHLKTGARAPKHGLIFQHELIQKSPREKRGKAARILADKISIAVKVDYFKGKFIADKLLKEIEAKLDD